MNVNEQTNNKFYHQWCRSIGGSERIFFCLLATSSYQNNIDIEKVSQKMNSIVYLFSRLRKDQLIFIHRQIEKDYFLIVSMD
jgi:hypothetical protein